MIVDSNVLLDLFNPTDSNSEAVYAGFEFLSASQILRTNLIVFAEISPAFATSKDVAKLISSLGISLIELSEDDAFRAGKAFREYRRNGGPRTTILPDFLIGAQASVRGWPVLTRDTRRFATYFPEVELIDPTQVKND